MTVTADLAAVSDARLEALVKRVVRSYHHGQEQLVAAEFAATASDTLLQMRPPAGSGEFAAGIAEGLEMAARTLLGLTGIPSTQDHTEETAGA